MRIKGSRQWESRGVRNVSFCPNLARTAAIEVRFSLNFVVVFDFTYFRFRPSNAKWISDVLPNRRNATIRSMFFSFFIMRIAYWRTESVCVLRQCAANCKKAREIKFGNYRRCKFGPHYLLAQQASLRQYIGAAQGHISLMIQQISFTLYGANNSPRFAYSSGHHLFILHYWGGNGNT